jgi:crotonobetainyl-CoA:carnitine CoA-transferase CaiB-like acyl-CoA transferase
MAELAENEHLKERGFWVDLPRDGGAARFPGPAFRMSGSPWTLRSGVPAPGEFAGEVQSL